MLQPNENTFDLYSRPKDGELLSLLELGNEILPNNKRKADMASEAEVFQQKQIQNEYKPYSNKIKLVFLLEGL